MSTIPTSAAGVESFEPAVNSLDQDSELFSPTPPFRHDGGLAWTVELPSRLQGETAKTPLPLAFYEDGLRLGPTNAMLVDIRSAGSGAHAFWLKHLAFSSSDGSDPNTNGRRYTIRCEVDLTKNHRIISEESASLFREFVIATRFSETVAMPNGVSLSRAQWLETLEGQKALNDTLFARLDDDRKIIVPWLNEARSLVDLRVLEIGCGTGSSTLAMAEQGAHVVGIDTHAGSLQIAKQRCGHYGVNSVEFYQADAADLPAVIKQRQFDLVIFFAALEHMTYDERLRALSDCWLMLPAGAFLCCTDTPNRLWHVDAHTSHLPFFHWLPDPLAIRYAKFSPRLSFRSTLGDFEPTPENEQRLIRAGRGLSFHEFELAIGPVQNLKVVSCLHKNLLYRIALGHREDNDDFIRSLMALAPGVHPAWFLPRLDIVIERP